MLLEIAIGDSYGAGFEFADPIKIQFFNKLERYECHPKDNIKAGYYTDDTQMSLAVAELIISGKKLTKHAFAKAFLDTFKRDPRSGYSSRFYDILVASDSPQTMLKALQPGSTRNGAMMRAVPVGLLSTLPEVLEVAKIQASVTHNSYWGILSSQVIAVCAYALMNNRRIRHLPELIEFIFGDIGIDYNWNKPVACDAKETLSAVMTVLTYGIDIGSHMALLLENSVNMEGDVDSVASIVLGLASLDTDIRNDLPDFLHNDLENGTYGREYLKKLDETIDDIKWNYPSLNDWRNRSTK